MLSSLLAGSYGPPPSDPGWPVGVAFIGIFVLIAVLRELRGRFAKRNAKPSS